MYKTTYLNWQGDFFDTYHFWVFLLLENPIGKTMNYNSKTYKPSKQMTQIDYQILTQEYLVDP
jgi:hypothetical protein